MEDLYLSEKIDEKRTLFVSPLSKKSYRDAGGRGLGGADGYFICECNESQPSAGFEILAKASSVDAAIMIFEAIRTASMIHREKPVGTATR
jgi:hypothetical protein